MKDRAQTCLTMLVAVPAGTVVLGGLIAATIFALRLADTWDQRNTDMLLTGGMMTCGLGFAFAMLVITLIVGVPLAVRVWGEGGAMRRKAQYDPWDTMPPPSNRIVDIKPLGRIPKGWDEPGRNYIEADAPAGYRPMLPGPGQGGGFGGPAPLAPFDGMDDGDSMFKER